MTAVISQLRAEEEQHIRRLAECREDIASLSAMETGPSPSRVLLAALLLLGSEAVDRGIDQVRPDDMENGALGQALAAMAALRARGSAVDLTTVHAELTRLGRSDAAAAVVSLDLTAPNPDALASYVRLVKEEALRREAAPAFERAARDLRAGALPGDVIANVARVLPTHGALALAPEPAPDDRIEVLTVSELLVRPFPPRREIVKPVIPEKGLVMVHAPRGLGKTWWAHTTGLAAASGGVAFPSPDGRRSAWAAATPREVVIVDGEMPAIVLKARFTALIAGGVFEPGNRLRIIADDVQPEGLPSLATPRGRARVGALLGNAELVILDNASTLFRGLDENEAEAWDEAQDWLIRLRREGRSVLLVHHSGKGGAQRGTSKREDVLDVVIGLRRPADYVEEEGARIEVHFEKARGLTGEDVLPFEVKLALEGGRAAWTSSPLAEEAETRRMVAMRDAGRSTRDIAKEFGIDQSTVSRRLQKADRRLKLAGDAGKGA